MEEILYRIDRDHGLDRERCLATEWLETDGCGGYASSTLAMCPTRQYHGFLVARTPGSAQRCVLLSRLEETVRSAGSTLHLSTARYPDDVLHPAGADFLQSFVLAPYPRALYHFGALEVERSLQVLRGRPAVLLRYHLRSAPAPVELELLPFLPYRDANHVGRETDGLDLTVDVQSSRRLRVQPDPALPALTFTADRDVAFAPQPVWYHDLTFPADQARGFEGREDQPTPGPLTVTLAPGEALHLAVSAGEPVADPRVAWDEADRRRRRLVVDAFGPRRRVTPAVRCRVAGDDFLYRDDTGRLGVLAGFPWFGEWGRDAFIALPGLTLARGRLGECAEALTGAVRFLKDGLLPNIYGDSVATSHYGSVDAALWFARAVELYRDAGGSTGLLRDTLLPALGEIARGYWEGTELGIRADEGGLIRAGGPDLNPTWMDAQTPAGPVTPREGFAVEINALWIGALRLFEELLTAAGRSPDAVAWQERRRLAEATFLERFWMADEHCLADLWNDGHVDASIRPNMVLAAALRATPLTAPQRAAVVTRARRELLTPRGLRTLAPSDARYCPAYGGGPEERDSAYHQGTVWPWLLGFYTEAALRAFGPNAGTKEELEGLWDGLEAELDRVGLNHLSEVFDGDPPHRPGGTIAQAWNTAEYLRARSLLALSELEGWRAVSGATR